MLIYLQGQNEFEQVGTSTISKRKICESSSTAASISTNI